MKKNRTLGREDLKNLPPNIGHIFFYVEGDIAPSVDLRPSGHFLALQIYEDLCATDKSVKVVATFTD